MLEHEPEEALGALLARVVEHLGGGPCSTITPPSMNTTRSPTSRAKPISWVTTIIVIPSRGELAHHVEHLLDQLRVERAGDLVEEHHAGVHRQRPGDRDPLLLAAGEPVGVLVDLVGEADAGEQRLRLRLAPPPRARPSDLLRGQRDVLERASCAGTG